MHGRLRREGCVTANRYIHGTTADAMLIDIPNALASNVLIESDTSGINITSAANSDFVGQMVCYSGMATNGTGCGLIQSTNSSFYDSDGYLHLAHRTVDFLIEPGDSGSPVYEPATVDVQGNMGHTCSSTAVTLERIRDGLFAQRDRSTSWWRFTAGSASITPRISQVTDRFCSSGRARHPRLRTSSGRFTKSGTPLVSRFEASLICDAQM